MQQSLHARAAATLPTQTCPKCAKPMRLTAIEPHGRYTNLDNRTFDCGCGETLTVVIARVE